MRTEFTKVARKRRSIRKYKDIQFPREDMVIWERYGGRVI